MLIISKFYSSHLVYPIAWCHATQMDHAGSGQVQARNSYGLRHLIQQSPTWISLITISLVLQEPTGNRSSFKVSRN